MGPFSRRHRDEANPGPLPLPPGPVSNGEFVPTEPTAHDRAVAHRIRAEVDDAARRQGIDRRRFLQTAGAVAASLATFELAGCSNPVGQKARPPTSGTSATSAPTTSAPGGTFNVPPTTDHEACAVALNGDGEFIFDVHTHHVMPGASWTTDAPETVDLVLGMLPAGCTQEPQLDCVDRAAYLHDLFLASDTTMAMLTDVPNSGPSDAPVPFPQELVTKQLVTDLTHGGAARLLVQNIVAPNVVGLAATKDEMTKAAESGAVSAFKVYTAWAPSGRGYSLLDPSIGLPVLQHAHDLGIRVFVAHKGLPLVQFDPAFNHPDDVVAASRLFPDMQFVVYHAAWDPTQPEGPYDAGATLGIDTLLASLDRHGVPRNDNVWVDVAAMWRQLLTTPDQAAHALGKLFARVGEERVMWGTDSIWFGSPQAQIMAMRAFEITDAYQSTYGYPALTAGLKRSLFGLNAARLFGVDPAARRCGLTSDPLTGAKETAAVLRDEGALPSPWHPSGPTTRRQVLAWLASDPSARSPV